MVGDGMERAPSAFEAAAAEGRDALRRRLLEEADRLLINEGPRALTMRRLAEVAGCSTTVLYTAFGGKDGLAEALYLEGFRRLGRALKEADHPADPLERAASLCRAYRSAALADPARYAVMFGGAIPGFDPLPSDKREALATMEPLIDTLRAAAAEDSLGGRDPEGVALRLWIGAHGLVSLELTGYLPEPGAAERHYEQLISELLAAGSA